MRCNVFPWFRVLLLPFTVDRLRIEGIAVTSNRLFFLYNDDTIKANNNSVRGDIHEPGNIPFRAPAP